MSNPYDIENTPNQITRDDSKDAYGANPYNPYADDSYANLAYSDEKVEEKTDNPKEPPKKVKPADVQPDYRYYSPNMQENDQYPQYPQYPQNPQYPQYPMPNQPAPQPQAYPQYAQPNYGYNPNSPHPAEAQPQPQGYPNAVYGGERIVRHHRSQDDNHDNIDRPIDSCDGTAWVFCILSFIIPLFGWIYYCCQKDVRPQTAKKCLIIATVAFIFFVFFTSPSQF